MSHRDDYSDEMFTKRLSDDDVEALLSGREPNDPTLAEIARALKGLDPKRFEDSSETKATEFAQKAAAVARAGEPAKLAATARYRRGLSLTPRLAPAAVAAILFFGLTGVAIASDEAAPGDPLYSIDRALENVGIGNGGAPERIAEANVLVERGEITEALDLLADSLGEESSEAADALLRASERIGEIDSGSEHANVVREDLAALLAWMSTTADTGREFGQGVAERAQDLGGGNQLTEEPGRSGETPGQTGEEPGQSGEAPGQDNQDQGDHDQDDDDQDNQGQGDDNPGQGQGDQGQRNSNKDSSD